MTTRTDRELERGRVPPPSPQQQLCVSVWAIDGETNFTISNFLFIQHFHSPRDLECHVYFFISLIIYSFSIVGLNCLCCWNGKQRRRNKARATAIVAATGPCLARKNTHTQIQDEICVIIFVFIYFDGSVSPFLLFLFLISPNETSWKIWTLCASTVWTLVKCVCVCVCVHARVLKTCHLQCL